MAGLCNRDAGRNTAVTEVAVEGVLGCLEGDAVLGGAVIVVETKVVVCVEGDAVRGSVTGPPTDKVLAGLAGGAVRGGAVTMEAADEVLVCLAGDAFRGGAVAEVAADEVFVCLNGDAVRGKGAKPVTLAGVLRGFSTILEVIEGQVILVSDTLDVDASVPGSLVSDTLDAEVGLPGSLMIWSPVSSTFMDLDEATNCSRHWKMHNSNKSIPMP